MAHCDNKMKGSEVSVPFLFAQDAISHMEISISPLDALKISNDNLTYDLMRMQKFIKSILPLLVRQTVRYQILPRYSQGHGISKGHQTPLKKLKGKIPEQGLCSLGLVAQKEFSVNRLYIVGNLLYKTKI